MFSIAAPGDFDLPRAVCSYGYFMLAPNRWDAAKAILHTVVTDIDGQPIAVQVRTRSGRLSWETNPAIAQRSETAAMIRRAVIRMLRLDEDFAAFHALHPAAKRARFGRLFRSATLFEDVVKTMTGCNTTWSSTMRMNALLCTKVGRGGFPTPGQIAALRPSQLQRACKVGYRAERIVRLARDVAEGRLDLAWFEEPGRGTDELLEALRSIFGIGPYAAANICHLLGRYDRMAIDSETYRHFREKHGLAMPKTQTGLRRLHKKIERHYDRYAPYQFLAYWLELWGTYESRFGDSTAWDTREGGPAVTGR